MAGTVGVGQIREAAGETQEAKDKLLEACDKFADQVGSMIQKVQDVSEGTSSDLPSQAVDAWEDAKGKLAEIKEKLDAGQQKIDDYANSYV